jgi:hypothetical protein
MYIYVHIFTYMYIYHLLLYYKNTFLKDKVIQKGITVLV